jgi:hypothetical protein
LRREQRENIERNRNEQEPAMNTVQDLAAFAAVIALSVVAWGWIAAIA